MIFASLPAAEAREAGRDHRKGKPDGHRGAAHIPNAAIGAAPRALEVFESEAFARNARPGAEFDDLADCSERNIGLDELAAAAGIGKFRLIRLP
jgi:hypothetical protein